MNPNGKISNKSELTPRQWELYRYLRDHSDEFTLLCRLAVAVKGYCKDTYELSEVISSNGSEFHDSRPRKRLTHDIRAINNSSVIQKIIISTPKGVKLANKEEFRTYIASETNRLSRQFQRLKKKIAKGAADQQMRIVFNSERDTIEAFVD